MGKGPFPTRVVYALATPMTSSMRVGPTPAADAGGARGRVGGRDVGVGPVIHVEQRALATFE